MPSALTPWRAGLFAFALVFGFMAIIFNTQTAGWKKWYLLSSSGKATTAVINRFDAKDHHTCYFSYRVAGTNYEGSGQGCALKVGQQTTVNYLPSDPHFAITGSASHELIDELTGTLFMSLLAGSGIGSAVARHRKTVLTTTAGGKHGRSAG